MYLSSSVLTRHPILFFSSLDTYPLFKSLDEPLSRLSRLSRCAAISTGEDGALPRSKPFKYTYEKEIVMYAYFKKLDYFSTECE
jgi:hypothetical protein